MARVLRVFRGRAFLIAGALLAALVMAIATQSRGQAAAPSANAMQMVLRLHELPPEYRIGDDSGCGPFDFEGTPAMTEFMAKYHPKGCYFEYERLFRLRGQAPDPPLVAGLTVTTPSVTAAEAGDGIAEELLGYATGDEELAEVAPEATIGDATKLFHIDHALVAGRGKQPGAALFWRSGSTLAAIYVAGRPSPAADRIALHFARLQQAHIEHPTPYTKAEQDYTLVPLENPAIRFPVYWLGRTFRPGQGRPPSLLRDAYLPIGPGGGPPGIKALLSYDSFSLSTYTRASWKQWKSSSLGDLVRGWHCTNAVEIAVPGGSAIVYEGYAKDFAACPARRPDVFLAEVRLGRVVVGIDLPNCEFCVEAGSGPYYSTPAMELIARSLRLRTRPGT